YFLFAVALLTAFFAFVPRQPEPWMMALLLAPLWLIGPWLDRRLEGLIDRLWLRRKYSAPDAERLFLSAVQQARNEPDLQTHAELKALRAEIKSHFLFNALNAIAGLIQDQPALADETIEQLAHVFRYTLRKSETEWVRLEEEIEFITAYLRVEQARFGHRLRV